MLLENILNFFIFKILYFL